MDKSSLLLLLLLGITLIALSMIFFSMGGSIFPIAEQLLLVIFSFLSFISLVFLFRYYGTRTEEGKVWFLLSLGFFLFFLVEMVRLFLVFTGGAATYLPYLDCIKLISYPLIFSSMFLESKWMDIDVKERILPLLPVLLLLLIALTLLALIPAVSSNTALAEKAFGIAFPILSLGLFCFSIWIAGDYCGGLLCSSWKVLSAAFGIRMVGEIVFLNSTLGGIPVAAWAVSSLFILSYSLVIFAAILRSASWNTEFEGL